MLLPRQLLRLEALALAVAAVSVYFHEGYSAWLFLALILAPDVTFVAYAAGPRVGAIVYNAAHSTIGPVALGAACLLTGGGLPVKIALIWLAHRRGPVARLRLEVSDGVQGHAFTAHLALVARAPEDPADPAEHEERNHDRENHDDLDRALVVEEQLVSLHCWRGH